MSLFSFLGTILTPVAGESMLQPCPRFLRRRGPCWWFWFFFGFAEKVCWVENDCFPLDVLARTGLVDLFFLESLSSFFVGLFPQRHLESILQMLKDDWSIAFASALMVFSTASSQESRSRPWTSIWAWTEGFRPSRKYRIMISLFGAAAGSNSWKTAYRCSRWAVQSKTSSCWCWEFFLNFPQ